MNIFAYSFAVRGLEAGILVALIAPLIGIFLVLRRYSLIADTLSHVSLAGVAVGLLLNLNPILTAITAAVLSSAMIERLRISKKIYGDAALAIFLSGSLALAIVLISLTRGLRVDLFNYLFGSIVTVKDSDVALIAALGFMVVLLLTAFYKELVYVSFDAETAQASGIPTRRINILLIMLAAVTVSVAIPIIGVLLISALLVIPVVTALQFKKSFKMTILIAEAISLFSVVVGVFVSFNYNLSTGGTIVLIALAIFIATTLRNNAQM